MIIGNDMGRLNQMDFEQFEILETSPEYFLRWLDAEVKALRWPSSQSLEFRKVGKTTLVTLQYPRTTMDKLEIEASATVEKDDEKVSNLHKWGVVIEFLTLQLNNHETLLTGGYRKYPGIKDYFDMLWKEILNVFPRRSITEQVGAQTHESTNIEKRGRSNYTKEDRLDAVKEWRSRDPDIYVEHLDEYLGGKFGYYPTGEPMVANSTFYDWQSKFKKEGKL